MTEYIHDLWRHSLPDDPVEMLYEVQSGRIVTRMVEVFRSGRAEANTLTWEQARNPLYVGIGLVDGRMPTASEIRVQVARNSPDAFVVHEISAQQFEAAFQKAEPLGELMGDRE